ncbi:MAG: hypothetical protein K2M91_01515 [Lachnospiraceae bacterium]|nr:hypothetical protein [Lachnospiraceae bacterium]
MNKLKLYCDYDNTLVNSIKTIAYLYNEDYKYYPDYKYIHWTDINTYNFAECNCAMTKDLVRYFTQPRFFEKSEFMDNAKEVLNKLKDKYEIIIVSMGLSQNLFGKEIWIKDNLPFAKFIGINMEDYKDKSHIDMSDGILIDDEKRYLDSSNANTKICFGDVYEWNEQWSGKRCYNWFELKKYLMEEVNMNK